MEEISVDDIDNINKEPSPFAPSDLSIFGIDTSQSSHDNSIILREKVVFVGDEAVGKTALIQSYLSHGTDSIHKNNYLMTCGADLNVKEVVIPNTNITVDLFLFDIGGQNVFNHRDIFSLLWKDCSYIVCVFDVSSRKSFQSCENWIQAIEATINKPEKVQTRIPVILVANKIDLRESDASAVEVDDDEGIQLAKDRQYQYFECSTQRSNSVDSLFMHIAMESASLYQEEREKNFE